MSEKSGVLRNKRSPHLRERGLVGVSRIHAPVTSRGCHPMTLALGDFGENSIRRTRIVLRSVVYSFRFCLSSPLQDRINASARDTSSSLEPPARNGRECSSQVDLGTFTCQREIIAGNIRWYLPPRLCPSRRPGFLDTDSSPAQPRTVQRAWRYVEDIRGVARRILFIREKARQLSKLRRTSANKARLVLRRPA